MAALLNKEKGQEIAVVVEMDGFHYYKSELDQMPNPQEAHERRGSHWTFDAKKFLSSLEEIKKNPRETIPCPSFEHHIGDPVQGAIQVTPRHQIVFVPGNYVLIEDEGVDGGVWAEVSRVLDEKWFVSIDIDFAMEALAKRHARAWNWSEERARERIDGNDRKNALFIQQHASNAHLTIPYVFDATLQSTDNH
uniref:Phosphoribulokinase/uridine kinase domain-containing protein n=1 Tax=Arcella intermedia TaxID=1963864 RepID=A0A6B2LHN4_9EUKA